MAAGRPLEVAVDAYPVLEDGLCLRPLLGALRGRPAPDRWERWQLHSLADDLAESRGAALAGALRRSIWPSGRWGTPSKPAETGPTDLGPIGRAGTD